MFVNLSYARLDPLISHGNLNASSTLWTIDPDTGSIQSYSNLNLNNFSLENVRSITSASGNWSVDENGVINATKLCLGSTCLTETQLQKILNQIGEDNYMVNTNNTSGGGVIDSSFTSSTGDTTTPTITSTTTSNLVPDSASTTESNQSSSSSEETPAEDSNPSSSTDSSTGGESSEQQSSPAS